MHYFNNGLNEVLVSVVEIPGTRSDAATRACTGHRLVG